MTPQMFIVCALSTSLAGIASLLAIVAAATDHWEHTDWDVTALRSHAQLVINASYFDETNQFFKVVTETTSNSGSLENTTSYLRSNYGGIWRLCDKLSDEFRNGSIYKAAKSEAVWLEYSCFNYITEYSSRKTYLDDLALSLVRMQNSASSCTIVSIMCLLTSAVIGILGVYLKQVSVCMVTGVMYIVSGVFLCFSLVIMMTKTSYIGDPGECHSIDVIADKELCPYRNAYTGYSVSIAWISVVFFFLSFMFWLLLSRFVRLEKAKSIL